MEFKDGDKLYCHTSEKEVVAGLYYYIVLFFGVPFLTSKNNKILGFDAKNYQKNLCTMKELRKMKLEKLNNESRR